ncbi:MAG: hypothetical protein FJ033_01355 [Chloroflexi bacterium]|nr:hypothetical protein [Chloroflexota bacterium]
MAWSVTTATVSTVTAAITMEGLGHLLALVAVLTLAIGLLAKEAVRLSDSRTARLWSRGLDIATVPLLVMLGMIAVLNVALFIQNS